MEMSFFSRILVELCTAKEDRSWVVCFFVIFIGIVGQLNQFLLLPVFSSVLPVFVFELQREEARGMQKVERFSSFSAVND